MITIAVDNSGRCRIRSIRAKPSISGMCMSVTTSKKGSAAACAAVRRRRAAAPPSTSVGFISQRLKIASRIRRLVRLSSTTKTFTPARISGATSFLALALAAFGTSSFTVK